MVVFFTGQQHDHRTQSTALTDILVHHQAVLLIDPKLLAREAKYANEDEYEEAKTQQLRRRRARRKASKKEAGPIKVGEVPILQDDSSSSGIGLSSSSSSEAESLASDSEYEGSSSGFRYSLNLVHDKIIDSNRKREG